MVVEEADIRNNPSMNVADHVKNLPAVDFAKTGMANSSIVVRGFNSVFTGTPAHDDGQPSRPGALRAGQRPEFHSHYQ